MTVLRPWREWHRPLMVNVTFMIGFVLVSAVGVVVDDRTLLDESVWMKPLKFSFAFALYAGTLAWLLTKLHKGRRFAWWVGTAFAVIATIEVAAITTQGARGTFSHFNEFSTDPVTRVLFPLLTYGVMLIYVLNLLVVLVVLRQRIGDRALNAALRAGLGLATLGMTLPMWWLTYKVDPRTVTDANGSRLLLHQSHGVGDPDGRGMPITHWSVTGGDYRPGHFLALHGIHVLLLITAVLAVLGTRVAWLHAERVRARLIGVAALGYTGLVVLITWQANRGQSLVHPDAATLVALAAVVLATAIGLVAVVAAARRAPAEPVRPDNTPTPATR
ncbi:hypothetical protein FHS29_006179 [Saccharothrix tamanrassetensis]|uniref:Uncharacterized protein n=1 Tax=Saccharothrix tamanrassetensis TaxID=1051531 RepID=A0A841CTU6_9PSEU|nr:hypothetical protein [Saccharothrix tamanrassetensis]MBB5959558.1 hypothetical protein [Saccharothrix tamanrassetensis]